MFVLIVFQLVINRFRCLATNIKNPWNFLFKVEVLVKPLVQTRKVHGYRERFSFLVY